MKVYISADMEGIASVCAPEEVNKSAPDYELFADQMTYEVACACEGAFEAGATQVVVKDAHGTGRNIKHIKLPPRTTLIRGWSGHPYLMMQGIDSSFDACVMLGYHSSAGASGNPLAHTISGSKVDKIILNGILATEFQINAYISQSHEVPVVLLSGDDELCETAKKTHQNISTIHSFQGVGNSVISKHPLDVADEIRKEIVLALKKRSECHTILPLKYSTEITFTHPSFAYSSSFFPGAEKKDSKTITFSHKSFLEVMKFYKFTIFNDIS